MVPAARVELAPHCWDMNLNHARLPIPPRGHRGNPEKGPEFLPVYRLWCKHNSRPLGQARPHGLNRHAGLTSILIVAKTGRLPQPHRPRSLILIMNTEPNLEPEILNARHLLGRRDFLQVGMLGGLGLSLPELLLSLIHI